MIDGFRARPTPPTWKRDERTAEVCPTCRRRLGVARDLFAASVEINVLACRHCHHCRLDFDDQWFPVDGSVLDRLEARLGDIAEQERLEAAYNNPAVWRTSMI